MATTCTLAGEGYPAPGTNRDDSFEEFDPDGTNKGNVWEGEDCGPWSGVPVFSPLIVRTMTMAAFQIANINSDFKAQVFIGRVMRFTFL